MLPLTALRTETFWACNRDFDKVAQEWPTGIPLTADTAKRAVELSLAIDWAAEHLLTSEELTQYWTIKQPAWDQYQAIQEPPWVQYKLTCAVALVEILAARSAALANCS